MKNITPRRRRFRREPFDRDRDFVCRRPFKCAGWDYGPGDPFDKSLVPTRRLRQFYEQRRVDHAPDGTFVPTGQTRDQNANDPRRAVVIPDGFEALPWTAMLPIAKALAPDLKNPDKATAVSVIAAEVARRAAGA